MDLKLTPEGDIAIENGDLVFVTGLEAIAQDITMHLRAWLGETPYDRTVGVPYLQIVFQRGVSIAAIRVVIEQQILGVEGVEQVLDLDTELDTAARSLTITGRVRATLGDVEFSLAVTA